MSEIIYTDDIEKLIKGIGEKALALSWLHTRSEKRYSYLNNYLGIPSIILSTIAGAGSISFGSIPEVSYFMGGISITVSVLATLNSYFSFAKRSESHKLTSVSYNKLYLQISIELALPRKKRLNVKDFMKSVSEQIVRLNEIQPAVPDIVIQDFKKVFKSYYGTDISLPPIVNGLVSISVCNTIDSIVPIAPIAPIAPIDIVINQLAKEDVIAVALHPEDT